MSLNDFDFDKLLFPIKTDIFFKEYWDQHPLIISRKKQNYYSDLFAMKDIDYLIAFNQQSDKEIGVFQHGKPSIDYYLHSWITSNNSFSINQLYDAYDQGNTIKLQDLQNSWKPIAILCRNLERIFNFKVNVNMYLTPKQSQGLAPHFDTQDVFILQIEGAKHWRIYDSFLSLPLDKDRQVVPKEKISAPLHEICLIAGDLLYIPRGYVHEAFTSDYSSLHLTVAIYPFRLADLISSALTLVSQQNVSFRKSLPVGFLKQDETITSLKHQFEELLELLLNSAKVEEAVHQLGKQFVGQMVSLPDGHFTQIDDLKTIELDTIVKKRDGVLCYIFKEEDSVSIQFPGNKVNGPSYIEPALCFIADSTEFTIRSIPNHLSEDGKLVLVRRLIKEGLLMIVQK